MQKENVQNQKSSITATELMDYLENKLKENRYRPEEANKIITGLWVERTSCTVRQHLAFDDVRGSRIIHYGIVDAFYELFKVMLENDLSLEDLKCYPYCYESSYPNPIIDFTVKTKEHEYKYYPVMLFDQCDSEKDEYIQIGNEIARMKAVYCDSNHKPEENG